MIERTRMFSENPSTPGRSAQAPRTIRSISTPACDAAYSARITASSSSAFIFAMIRAGLPSRAWRASRRIAKSRRSCIVNGASSRCFSRLALARLVMCRNTSLTSAQISGLAVSSPKSV